MSNNFKKICIGCEQLGGTDWGHISTEDVVGGIQTALELGITSFDTSNIYGLGQSEIRLGEVLAGFKESPNICLFTKGGLIPSRPFRGGRATIIKDSSSSSLIRSVNESLVRLGLDQIPIYLLHWWDTVTPLSEVLETFVKLRKMGKIREFGFCNLKFDTLASLLASTEEKFWYQDNLSLIHTDSLRKFSLVKSHGCSAMAYGVLAQGLLTGKYQLGASFDENDRRHRLEHFSANNPFVTEDQLRHFLSICSKNNVSPVGASTFWASSIADVDKVIVGCKNSRQVLDNVECFNAFAGVPSEFIDEIADIFMVRCS